MEKLSFKRDPMDSPLRSDSPAFVTDNSSVDQKEKKRKRREIFLIFLFFAIFSALSYVEFSLGSLITGLPFNDNILFFSIINLNIILILLMIFLIVRNVVKLVFENRRKVLGAKLRIKLVAAFVFLSLAPTVILFYVAWSFISRSVEMWVHVQVELALEGAMSVSKNYYIANAEGNLYFAKQIGQAIQREGLLRVDKGEALREFLRLQQIAYRLDSISLMTRDSDSVRVLCNSGKPAGLALPKEADLRDVWKGKENTRIRAVAGVEVLEAMVPVPNPQRNSSTPYLVLVVQTSVPVSLVEKMVQISESLERHQQMMLFKYPFKSAILMALMMVTLLILFSATWFGFYLAKGITTPIQRLAEGIRDVAAGNLTHRIESGPDDELGILVDSYNKMLDDLKGKDEQVEEAQDRLYQTNVELDQRRIYMEIMLRNIGSGVLSLDREGKIRTINRFMEDLFSIQGDEFLGEHYTALFRTETMQPMLELISEVNQRRYKALERQIRVSVQREPKNLLVRASVLEDEGGGWMGVVMVFEDHSELIRAQRAAAWREVARRIAHEIKNPLTPIQLSAQRLQKRYKNSFEHDGKVFDECISTIIRQVEEMKNIVNEFSLFARMPAAKPVISNLNEIVHDTLSLYRQAHRSISFKFEQEPSLPPLLLDPDQIRRVLTNLIDNAVDATEGRGEIRIITHHDSFLRIAGLEIADDGCGIPKEMRDRVFEPYASSKKGGTGLGLVIVKTIVADHNGYIRVRDNEPKGTRLFLEFPVPVT